MPLDRMYIRLSPDKKDLIIGDQSKSKEYTLATDGHDAQSIFFTFFFCFMVSLI
jgi:hypothetical protein